MPPKPAHSAQTRTTDGRSVELDESTGTICIRGSSLSHGALALAQSLCLVQDVLTIVSLIAVDGRPVPENHTIGYMPKRAICGFVTDIEKQAVERGWLVKMSVYDGHELVVTGCFDGLAMRPDPTAN